jgi:hypothetical protein
MLTSAMQRDEALRRIRAHFAADPSDAVAVYLFGSVARDEARPGSDVDVAVLLRAEPRPGLQGLDLRLEGDLERRIGCRVQLVVLNRAPADLVHRVLRDGVLVLDLDPSARIRFEVRARNEYFDLLPFLLRYRRSDGRAA